MLQIKFSGRDCGFNVVTDRTLKKKQPTYIVPAELFFGIFLIFEVWIIYWTIQHGRLTRWIKRRACDVGKVTEGLENEYHVGEATEVLEDELWQMWGLWDEDKYK